MSRQNKVNPDHYTTGGRLSPDDLARERRKQSESPMGGGRHSNQRPIPPWMMDTGADDEAGAAGVAGAKGATGATGSRAVSRAEKKTTRRQAAPKAAGARKTPKTPKTAKAPRARGSAARSSSPQRGGRPGSHKAASSGRQEATPQKGTARRGASMKNKSTRAKAKKR